MQHWVKRLTSFEISPTTAPLLLLAVAVLAYGLLIPQLGFYWDDYPMSWIRYQLGPEAMTRYFSTNRPAWGLLHQVTTRLLPHIPIYWQTFALFWRWAGAVVVWAIFRELWPRQTRFALAVSLLFLIYPGFNQQWVSYLYSHFFIVLFCFLLSLLCVLWSLRCRRWRWPFTVLSMLSSAANLLMMEYFFLLEGIRPILVWLALRDEISDRRVRLRRTLTVWLPYLAVFLTAVIWRTFLFKNQVYDYNLLARLAAQPTATFLDLIRTILVSLWTVSAAAWAQVFVFPSPAVEGPRTTLGYAAIVLVTFVIVLIYLHKSRRQDDKNRTGLRTDAAWAIGLGLFSCLIAGWPFWLIDLPPGLGFPLNRFTLPFMLGVSLILAGLMALIPRQNMRILLLTALISLAIGRHFVWANEYRRDWNVQKNFFWQMSWRIPSLEVNTLLIINEQAFKYYADNSLSAPLNWIYAPENHSEQVYYMLFFPGSRLGGGLPALEKGLPVGHDFIAAAFEGNTSQTVVFYYAPPACLRVLDAEIDPNNHSLPDLLRQAAFLSATTPILAEGTATMPDIFNPEPPHEWCFYFEKADLARQQGDWDEIAELGSRAFNLGDHPNDPMERLVFVEGYAHAGDWKQALQLSEEAYHVAPNHLGPLLCSLWNRINGDTADSPEKQEAMEEVQRQFNCAPA